MAEKISVSKVELKIGKNTLRLSIPEVKELRDMLDALLPKDAYIPGTPAIIIERPVVVQPGTYWHPFYNICGTGTNAANMDDCTLTLNSINAFEVTNG